MADTVSGKSDHSLEQALQRAGEAASQKWSGGQHHHVKIADIKLELKPHASPNPGIIHEYTVDLEQIGG
jgi:hypothetical protein